MNHLPCQEKDTKKAIKRGKNGQLLKGIESVKRSKADYYNRDFIKVPGFNKALQHQKVKQVMADYLEKQAFTHFVTFTTGYEMTLPTARRYMDRLFKKLAGGHNSNLPGVSFSSDKPLFQVDKSENINTQYPCKMFWVAEPFDIKEGFHTHALLQIPESFITYKELHKVWQRVTGERKKRGVRSRIDIQKYIPMKGANHYIGKYLQKYNSDYDYFFTK